MRFFSIVAMLTFARCVAATFCPAVPGQSPLFGSSFTGVNVFRRDTYQIPAEHHWYVVVCDNGRVTASQMFATTRDSNIPWTSAWPMTDDLTLWAARRKELAERQLPIFRAGKLVGGLYHMDNTSLQPVSVLEAAGQGSCFRRFERLVLVKYCHVLTTPQTSRLNLWSSWVQRTFLAKIDPHEQYNYTNADLWTPWHAANKLVNAAATTWHMEDDQFPWGLVAANSTALNITSLRQVIKL